MKNIGEALKLAANKTGFWFKKNSPELLVISGILTAGASVVLACRATKKVDKIIKPSSEKIKKIHSDMKDDDLIRNNRYSVADGRKDLIKEYGKLGWQLTKLYGPAAISFSLSVASMIGSHNIMKGRNLALAAAYTTAEAGYKSYRERVAARFGSDVEEEIYKNLTEKKITSIEKDEEGNEKKVTKKVKVPSVQTTDLYSYLFDASNRNWNNDGRVNLSWLLMVEKFMNEKLRCQGNVFLCDVYDALGIEPCVLGEDRLQASRVLGWIYDPKDETRDNYVSFGLTDKLGNLNDYAMDLKKNWGTDVWLEFNVDGDILTGNGGQKTFMKYAK